MNFGLMAKCWFVRTEEVDSRLLLTDISLLTYYLQALRKRAVSAWDMWPMLISGCNSFAASRWSSLYRSGLANASLNPTVRLLSKEYSIAEPKRWTAKWAGCSATRRQVTCRKVDLTNKENITLLHGKKNRCEEDRTRVNGFVAIHAKKIAARY